jgi:hypothetical protein
MAAFWAPTASSCTPASVATPMWSATTKASPTWRVAFPAQPLTKEAATCPWVVVTPSGSLGGFYGEKGKLGPVTTKTLSVFN